ncbi:hypothetical protein BOX30_10645 [Leptospirillum ferriphilum]|nr:hypothetical protein BOX30_10645 [Leptospirillum ferriphilum]
MSQMSLTGFFFSWKKKLSFGADVRRKFYSDLASILRTDGSMSPVQIRTAIDEFRKLPSAPKAALREISAGLGRGLDFSAAIRNLAPESETLILRSAEETGDPATLVRLLKNLAFNMEEVRKIRKSFLGSVQYPVFLLLNAGGLIVYFSDSILPKIFEALRVDPSRLFGFALVSYDFFTFVRHFWFVFVLIPVFLIALVGWSLRLDFPGRRFLDRIPPWSIYRLLLGTEFLTGLSAMLEAGIPVMRAFDQLRRQAPPYLRARIEPVMRIYKRTGKLGEAMDRSGSGFPSREIIIRLTIREGYGDLGGALAEFSRDWKEEGLPKIERQSKILNFVAMTFAAGLIGILIGGLFQIQQQAMAGFGF